MAYVAHGPWVVEHDENYIYIGPRDSVSGRIEAIVVQMVYHPNRMGNAKMIAAAPSLFKELKSVWKKIDDSDEWWLTLPERGGFDFEAITKVLESVE